MLTVHHVWKSFGIVPVLKDINLTVNPGEHVGLVGPNGCGKSTLLGLAARVDVPDKGQITYQPSGLRVGYVAQGLVLPEEVTVEQYLSARQGEAGDDEAELTRLAQELMQEPNNRVLQTKYDYVLERMEGRLDFKTQVGRYLRQFGLADVALETLVEHLSGGQKTRLALMKAIIYRPELLLLDEPTNHLDDQMLVWLEDWLKSYSGACLVVSHDRAFLDAVAEKIFYLDAETHTLKAYAGNYSDFQQQYDGEIEKHWETYKDQVYKIRSMRQDIQRTKQQSLQVELSTTPRQPFVRRIAKLVARKAKSREKKLERFLDSDEIVEKPRDSWRLKMDWEAGQISGKDVLRLEGISIGYAKENPLLTDISLVVRRGERIALTGPNGCGKTTLLRTVMGRLPALTGEIYHGAQVKYGWMAQEQETLDGTKNALEIIREIMNKNDTEVRTFLHLYLFKGDEPLVPVKNLSYGERARLTLAALVADGCNFLLLDEPINHLDIPSRDQFEQAIQQFDGTILAVVHDRYFVSRFATRIWQAGNGKILDIV